MSNRFNLSKDLYISGRIGWKGLNKDEYLDESDYRIINATALENGYIDWNNCGYISKERFEESQDIILQENDILISKDGTLGKIGYVKNLHFNCTVAAGIFVLRKKNNKINFDYLYHLLKSDIFKDFISRNKASGSTINHLYQRDLENFEIELPDLNTQLKIAGLLNLIDFKISNNKSTIKTLESTIKTIYDYWFIQFEFPSKDFKPYKTSGGEVVFNNKINKFIPVNWKVDNLYSIADFINGLACQNYRAKEGEPYYDVIKIKEMNNGITLNTEKCTQQIPTKYVIHDGNILFSWSASLNVIYWYGGTSALNQHIFKVIPKSQYLEEYTYQVLRDYVFTFSKIANSRKTTMGHITSDHIKQSVILIPPEDILSQFSDAVFPLRKKIEVCSKEIISLHKLKDFIFPLLINGQVSFMNI